MNNDFFPNYVTNPLSHNTYITTPYSNGLVHHLPISSPYPLPPQQPHNFQSNFNIYNYDKTKNNAIITTSINNQSHNLNMMHHIHNDEKNINNNNITINGNENALIINTNHTSSSPYQYMQAAPHATTNGIMPSATQMNSISSMHSHSVSRGNSTSISSSNLSSSPNITPPYSNVNVNNNNNNITKNNPNNITNINNNICNNTSNTNKSNNNNNMDNFSTTTTKSNSKIRIQKDHYTFLNLVKPKLKHVEPTIQPKNIQNVYAHNFIEEVAKIENIIEDYPYIAIDTEFPGIVARPVEKFNHFLDYSYRVLSENVNLLKLIQLGLTFYNKKGESPLPINTWQFNFKFNVDEDLFSPESIQLLLKAGIDFEYLKEKGIPHKLFAEIITMSGIVLNDDVRWICFHGAYDFAYLLKTLTHQDLPANENEFFKLLRSFFPHVYDLKVLLRNINGIKGGGLQNLAANLHVKRRGTNHQAGSDSLLTGDVFFKMMELYFEQLLDERKYLNTLYGLGSEQWRNGQGSIFYYN